MTSSVLVTGARGYLGGRVMVDLAADTELCLVGASRSADIPLGWPLGCPLVRMDPLKDTCEALVSKLAGVDTVLHLAAPSEVVAARHPQEALVGTAVATLNLLQAAQRAGCRRFIFLSTIHVYGAPLRGRITETDLAYPLHPYAIAHRVAEDFVLAAHAKKEIEGVVVRLSNGIGAPAWAEVDRWTLVGNDLCQQAVRDGRVALRSSGLQWRDFILLRDFVAAVRLLVQAPAASLGNGLFNLGGRLPLRMRDVAEIVAQRGGRMLGREIVVETAAALPGESWPDIDYSIDRIGALGFTPSPLSALEAEIDATLAICRNAQKNC